MNKFLRISLVVAFCLLLLGMLLAIVGFVMGGRQQLGTIIKSANLNTDDFHIKYKNNDYNNINVDFGFLNDEYDVFTGNYSDDQVADVDEINELSMSVGGGEIIIKETEEKYFKIEADTNGDFQYYIEDECLYIAGLDGVSTIYDNNITLYIPKSADLELIDLSFGGGEISVETFIADEVDMELAAGVFTIDSLKADHLEGEIGAGELVVDEVSLKDCDITVGMGSIQMNGTVKNDISIECAMGSVDLYLTGDEDDHNYDLECVAGNITLGNHSHSGFVIEKKIDNEQDSLYQLNCYMGNISILYQ